MKTRPLGDNTADSPSREEIEALCILDAIGSGCYLFDLARRLGFSPGLAAVVATSIEPLRSANLVTLEAGQLSLTAAGNSWLATWRSITAASSRQ